MEENYRVLEQEILNFRNSIITRLFKHAQIDEKENQLQSVREQVITYEKKYVELSTQLEALEDTRIEKIRLRESRDVLNKFYQEQSEFLPEYEKKQEANKRAASIECIVEDYNVFFVHAIHPNFVPGNNSMLEDGITWQEKLKIAIGFDPAISVSSIKTGDNAKNFWAHFGILLKKGVISGAHSSDAASMSIDLNTRIIEMSKPIELSKQVKAAIYNRAGNKYNEFVVDDTEIAGLFLFPSEDRDNGDYEMGNMPAHPEVSIEADHLGLPVYLFLEGSFVPSHFDDAQQIYVPTGDRLNPKNILEAPLKVAEEVRTMAREEILKDSPFKMGRLNDSAYEEFSCLLSYAQGRKMFTGLYLGRNKISGGEREIVDDQSVRVICRFPEPGSVNKMYVTEDGDVVADRVGKNNKIETSRRIRTDDYKSEYITIGQGSTYRIGSIFGIRGYTQLMNLEIQKLLAKSDSATDEKTRIFDKKNLKRLAAHCLGFADQAALLGDNLASEIARQVALPIMDRDDLKELSNRRLGQNGEMLIAEDDLYHTKNTKVVA